MGKYVREAVNGITHLIGAILAFAGLLALVIKTTIKDPSVMSLSAVIIFGISLILLYSASATYHLTIAGDDRIKFLRKIDHSMIFILIAGSYAPFCLISLKGIEGFILFGILLFIAILGVCFKLIWFNCPRWISTLIYVAMGWMAIFVIKPLYHSLSIDGLILLVAGGLAYTVGAVIYGLKPSFLKFKNFEYHEIFHLFIMLGSILHFICVYVYVI
ncbi:hemolysin III family protein [Romboutsia sp. CE17]|uniref:PAQR family membrane homeostasis protein TrhA n=1 Tax=Romboutsia sp. CE17 TaxID=2724150 RepID=UPI001442DC9E|nr:hemolysin III family protein [Romboutsia sp. CE17]QJA09640.1 hemolysin III family protein [Romboutsia sp. CE17]